MKKKQYMIPELVVVEFEARAALLMGSIVYDDPADPQKEVLGRDSDFWDDEE